MYVTVLQTFSAEDRLPKEIENQIMEEYALIERLLKDGKNDEVLKVFKNIMNKIKENYPTNTKELFKIGTQYSGSMFGSIFRSFIKNKHYSHAEEVSRILVKDLPHNFVSLRSTHDIGDVYNYKKNNPAKAIEYYQRVVNDCVPKFYPKLEGNGYCVSAAKKLSLLYEGDERSINLWKRIIEENHESNHAREARDMIYIVENYSDHHKKPLKLYLKTDLWLKKGPRKSLLQQLPLIYKEIIDNYPQWKLTPYIYYLLADYYEERYYYEGDDSAQGKAIFTYKSFLEKFPDHSFPPPFRELKNVTPSILMKIGDLYQKINPVESIVWYQKIIEKHHDEIGDVSRWGNVKIAPFAYLRIGWIYEIRLKQYKDAIEAYKRVINEFPDFTEKYVGYPAITAHFRIVRIYYEYLGDINNAKTELMKIYNTYPNKDFIDLTVKDAHDEVRESKAEATLQLARLYLRETDYNKSLKYYKILLNDYHNSSYGVNQSDCGGYYGERAVSEIINFYNLQQKTKQVIKVLHNIISSHKSKWIQAYAQYKLGEVYEKYLNDKKMAMKEYRKVLRNYPDATTMFSYGPSDMAEKRLDILEKGVSSEKVNIIVTPTTSLHKIKKQFIYNLRTFKVNEYSEVKIFHENYMPDESIFGQINERADWIYDTQFFVVNPYLLVLTSAGNKVNALLPYCSICCVEFSKNKIEVKYSKQSASRWFYYIFDYYSDSKGIVRLWFVNAYDAGFKYAYVDMTRSTNLEPEPNSPADSVLKNIFAGHESFHLGRSGKNNISPDEPRAKLRLKEKNANTVIYIKLWKNRPMNKNTQEEFAYVIRIEPEMTMTKQ